MKKITILFSILIASIGAFAQATTTSQITLSSASQGDKVLQIVVASQFSNAVDYSYDAVVGAGQAGGLYIVYNSDHYTKYATNNLGENLPLGFGAVEDSEYTFNFSYFTGTSFTIYDKKLGKTITVADNILVNGVAADPANKYTFSIEDDEKNTAINDRFVINYDPDALKYDIELNGHYLATFSAPENVIIPKAEGLEAYTAEFQGEQGNLLVHKITGNYIPANTGVILFNTLGGTTSTQYDFSLFKYAGDVDPIEGDNDLKPSSDWVYPFEGTVYVLHDSEMWLYNGANMKKNKAYLHVQAGSAPQRIRMVFSEEQGIESIAAEGKAVKFVENGRVFIKRGDKVYNLQGQLVK